MRSDVVRLFQTLPHTCGYYAERTAQNLVIDPSSPQLDQLYEIAPAARLSARWRPCLSSRNVIECRACVACRIPVDALRSRPQPASLPEAQCRPAVARRAGRLQRGTLRSVSALFAVAPSRWRHGRCPARRFLALSVYRTGVRRGSSNSAQGRACSRVAVTDFCEAGLSAVYTFYDPRRGSRGLGTFAILKQIDIARERGLSHVYLGFWIAGHIRRWTTRSASARSRSCAAGSGNADRAGHRQLTESRDSCRRPHGLVARRFEWSRRGPGSLPCADGHAPRVCRRGAGRVRFGQRLGNARDRRCRLPSPSTRTAHEAEGPSWRIDGIGRPRMARACRANSESSCEIRVTRPVSCGRGLTSEKITVSPLTKNSTPNRPCPPSASVIAPAWRLASAMRDVAHRLRLPGFAIVARFLAMADRRAEARAAARGERSAG